MVCANTKQCHSRILRMSAITRYVLCDRTDSVVAKLVLVGIFHNEALVQRPVNNLLKLVLPDVIETLITLRYTTVYYPTLLKWLLIDVL